MLVQHPQQPQPTSSRLDTQVAPSAGIGRGRGSCMPPAGVSAEGAPVTVVDWGKSATRLLGRVVTRRPSRSVPCGTPVDDERGLVPLFAVGTSVPCRSRRIGNPRSAGLRRGRRRRPPNRCRSSCGARRSHGLRTPSAHGNACRDAPRRPTGTCGSVGKARTHSAPCTWSPRTCTWHERTYEAVGASRESRPTPARGRVCQFVVVYCGTWSVSAKAQSREVTTLRGGFASGAGFERARRQEGRSGSQRRSEAGFGCGGRGAWVTNHSGRPRWSRRTPRAVV